MFAKLATVTALTASVGAVKLDDAEVA